MRSVVAGGGVAGGAAACLLGREAMLIEREAAPHDKICGDFISAEAHPYLRRLGVGLEDLGAAAVHAVRLVHGGRVASSRLPFPAFGLSRRVLDEALLQRAAARGAEVVRGHAISSFDEGVLQVAGLGAVPAPSLFLATGKHDLRGVRRQPDGPPEDLVGLKMYFLLAPSQEAALRGHVEVILFAGGYAGLQLVEGGTANLCLLIARPQFEEAGRSWAGVQAALERQSSHLARRLDGARPLLDRPLSIFRVPYGFVHQPRPSDPANVYRLGDQVAVVPSFSGDGMAIALHTAFAAVASHRAGGAARHHHRMQAELSGQIGWAGRLYRMGRAVPHLTLAAARVWPGALRWAARLTRIPEATVRAYMSVPARR